MKIHWYKRAFKEIEKLEKDVSNRILDKIEEAVNRPEHYLDGLKGTDFYKLRIGDYRVILDWKRKKDIIIILMIGKRSKIYKKLDRNY